MKSTRGLHPKNIAITNIHYYCIHFTTQKNFNEWFSLNFNQNFNAREKTLRAFHISNYKIGKNNKISNRFTCLNNKIDLEQLNKKILTNWLANKYSLNSLVNNYWTLKIPNYNTSFSIYDFINIQYTNNHLNVIHSYNMYLTIHARINK